MPGNPPPNSHRTLAALADQALVTGLLDDWLAQRGRPSARPWRREYARYHPGQDPWAVCLYEGANDCLLRLEALAGPQRANLTHSALGPVLITEFPDDPALPGLADVMAMLERPRVVRYRPGHRCTLRGYATGGERFVKVIPGGERIYADALQLWKAFQSGEFSMTVAEPYGWHEPTQSFWQGVVHGGPALVEVLGPKAEAFVRRLGVSLGELASCKLQPSLSSAPAEHLQRTTRALSRATLAMPLLERRIEQVRIEFERRHAALPHRALVPVHGAPHVHQWLVQGTRLGLLDFDRFALGEPEYDLATFLAELDTERGLQRPVQAIEAALFEGFESKGARIDRGRAALYRAHKRVAKVARTAWALRADARQRAEHHLQTVEVMLERT